MQEIINAIQSGLLSVFGHEEIVIVLIAILPIVEVRLAVPMAFGYGLAWYECFAYSFVGSSLMIPLLLAVLIPFIKWLSKTKLFRKIGDALYSRFEEKSQSIDPQKSERKKALALMLFVAIPLPLTGVWTGCAIGSILKLKYKNALLAVLAGNAIASAIMTLLCAIFEETVIDYIILAIGVIAIAVVILLIVKILLHKPKKVDENEQKNA